MAAFDQPMVDFPERKKIEKGSSVYVCILLPQKIMHPLLTVMGSFDLYVTENIAHFTTVHEILNSSTIYRQSNKFSTIINTNYLISMIYWLQICGTKNFSVKRPYW